MYTVAVPLKMTAVDHIVETANVVHISKVGVAGVSKQFQVGAAGLTRCWKVSPPRRTAPNSLCRWAGATGLRML